ncbi:ATP-binding protein [Hyphomicrobium sp. D-2]|uniref:ATP-binding protein n=1 Tax=Hyphomicrobium sp. D-2 TaxID=3041621 RepID=UPI002454E40A|nr:ATP-binding protein [Hyphomicrobium sp. D-2]MDH4983827.1 ATP-binding protein [Hyphomicrobium sp. D-2]
MADLRSDIVGRVNRLPVKPSEKGALLPLMEAISNSIHSVTEQYGPATAKKGHITVTVARADDQDDHPVHGFDIEDNGAGFTPANYLSFLTPDSRFKEKKGGKGVGRLAWLKVFKQITVDSTFRDKQKLMQREFSFQLTEVDQVPDKPPRDATGQRQRTIISFRGFTSDFDRRCPAKGETIAHRIISHFVPLFVTGNAPKITLIDGEDTLNVESMFAEAIVDQTTTTVQVDDDGTIHTLELWNLKCKKVARFHSGGHNFAFLSANTRSVVEYTLDEQLGLRTLDGEYVYLGCVSGDYLDRHVNAERSAFAFDGKELDVIKKAVARGAREYLTEYVRASLDHKAHVAREIIAENPQFLYVEPQISSFTEALQPNCIKKEDIFVELARNRFRRQKKFADVGKEIATKRTIGAALDEKISQYQEYIRDEKKGALAEYVVRRKAVLDLFETFLEYEDADSERYKKEEAIHQLICPMRVDSHALEIDDHNLWMLDDRLAFSHYFSSDLEVRKFCEVASTERPDLAFFFSTCVAWREAEGTDTVVIVEFKRPMREDYSKGKDPVQQVLHYVKTLKSAKGLKDVRGKAIRGINDGTAFHCYIVCDITDELEERIIGRLQKTPDGEGYFGYQQNPNAYIELLPYGKLLRDARKRNVVFFDKLGITNVVGEDAGHTNAWRLREAVS